MMQCNLLSIPNDYPARYRPATTLGRGVSNSKTTKSWRGKTGSMEDIHGRLRFGGLWWRHKDGTRRKTEKMQLVLSLVTVVLLGASAVSQAQSPASDRSMFDGSQTQSFSTARDPGVRVGKPGAGDPIAGLTPDERERCSMTG
jgi:hypothetical protein